MRLIRFGVLFALACAAWAGTTVIHVDTEDGGNVEDATHNVVNAKGALFWNGSKWVTNDTAAHMYFTDLRTGERLQNYAITVVQGNTPGTVATPFSDFAIQRSLYNYQKAAPAGVVQVSAVQYRIARSGRSVVLRSRAAGVGTANAYFDIYVENENGSGVTAMRGDPVWFSYPMGLDQAIQQTSPTTYLSGYLASVGANYFLDVNSGSDLGGVTYQIRTAALPGAIPALGLGSPFATSFSYKWMDAPGQLQELQFLPYADASYAPAPVPVPTPVPPTAILVLTGLAGAGLHHLRKRKRAGDSYSCRSA